MRYRVSGMTYTYTISNIYIHRREKINFLFRPNTLVPQEGKAAPDN